MNALYRLGNYAFKFIKHSNDINIIEIYTQDRNKLCDIKMNKESILELCDYIHDLCNYNINFDYNIPLYNINENTIISGYYDMKIIDNQKEECITIQIIKENINDQNFFIDIFTVYYDLEIFSKELYNYFN